MDSEERDDKAFLTTLEAVPLPNVDAPLFKAQLKARLLAEAARAPRPAPSVRPAWWRYALVAAALLVVLAWQLTPASLPALAYIEIEVNPSVRLTIDSRGQVIGLESLDDQARLALSELRVLRQPAPQAVAQVMERLHRAGLLKATSQVWLVVSPIGEARAEAISELLAITQAAVSQQSQHLLATPTTAHSLIVDRERYEIARQATLRPSQYARVAKAGVSVSGMQGLVLAGKRLQAADKITGGRMREFMELVAELVEAGLPEGEALQLVESMLASGQSVQGLGKRIEKAVERIEEGLALKEAVRELREGAGKADDRDDDEDRDEDKDNERGQDKERGREREDEREREDDRGGGRGRDNERERDDEGKDEDEDEGEDERERDNERDDESEDEREPEGEDKREGQGKGDRGHGD